MSLEVVLDESKIRTCRDLAADDGAEHSGNALHFMGTSRTREVRTWQSGHDREYIDTHGSQVAQHSASRALYIHVGQGNQQ